MRWICLATAGVFSLLVPRVSVAQGKPPPPGGAVAPAPKDTPPAASPGEAAKPAPPAPTSTAPGAPGAAPNQTPEATPPGAPDTGPPKDAAKPGASSAPPEYYVEEQKKGAIAPGAVGPGYDIYEPPPPPVVTTEPPPPIEPSYLAPKTAFWAGLRLAYFVPFGTLWFDGSDVGQGGLVYRRRLFSAYASSGPAAEVDIGARVGRRYNFFAMWEHASLGTGDLDPNSFGGQERGATNLYGAGFRFSTQPNTVGFLLELDLGYRDFRAYWADGTELTLNDTFFDLRVGFGVDIRTSKWLSISPMVVFGGGSFQSSQFSGPHGTYPALTALDREGEYGTVSLQIGAHADVF